MDNISNFQDRVRALSITGFNQDDPLYYNGWSQLWAMKQLQSKYHFTDEFNEILNTALSELATISPLRNVREHVKRVLMFPNFPKYEPFKEHDDHELLNMVKQEFVNKRFFFESHNNKINLVCDKPPKFERNGYDSPEFHITIFNSNEFEKFKELEDDVNELLTRHIDDIQFTRLSSTSVTDYPLYEEVIVANLESDQLKDLLKVFYENLRGKLDDNEKLFEIDKDYHLTILAKLRKEHQF